MTLEISRIRSIIKRKRSNPDRAIVNKPRSEANTLHCAALSVEKLTGAHTEGEIKVLVELYPKLAGS